MRTVIGLGSAGCRLADAFKAYDNYDVYSIDVGIPATESSFKAPLKGSHEEYEKSAPSFDEFFRDIDDDEVLFITCGAGAVSGLSLKILESLKDKPINVLYIQPELELLGKTSYLQNRVVFNVFQEYTRSGVFEKMIVVDNAAVEKILGGVPVSSYYEKINQLIVSTIHMINVFNNSGAVVEQLSPPSSFSRICSPGVFDIDSGEEKLFFPLDSVTETQYYYAINNQMLEDDAQLFMNIKNQVKNRVDEHHRASYSIHSTSYEYNYAYCVGYSRGIQN